MAATDYPLIFTAVLPYRAAIPSAVYSCTLGGNTWLTTPQLLRQQELLLGPTGPRVLTPHSTIACLHTRKKRKGTLEEFRAWVGTLTPDECAERLNTMILAFKYAATPEPGKALRPVGYPLGESLSLPLADAGEHVQDEPTARGPRVDAVTHAQQRVLVEVAVNEGAEITHRASESARRYAIDLVSASERVAAAPTSVYRTCTVGTA